jgi:hypothetical protein
VFARDLAAIRTCRGNSRLVEFDVVGACKKTPPKIPKGGGHSLRMIALLLEKAGLVSLSPACSVNDLSVCDNAHSNLAHSNLLHRVALALRSGEAR